MTRIPVRKLMNDALKAESFPTDWTGHEEDDDLTVYQVDRCSSCDKYTDAYGYCNNRRCEHYREQESDRGPMINYRYPLPVSFTTPERGAWAIRDLPLCITEVDGEYALALCGGGMNMVWEIAEAFMRLGYLPPVAYTYLPDYSDKKQDATYRWIVGGCRRALRENVRLAKQEAASGLLNLSRLGKRR